VPKRGRALAWPSILDTGDYGAYDICTTPQALPVDNGANTWIHMYDFKAPYSTE
jgi:hypothetical protein